MPLFCRSSPFRSNQAKLLWSYSCWQKNRSGVFPWAENIETCVWTIPYPHQTVELISHFFLFPVLSFLFSLNVTPDLCFVNMRSVCGCAYQQDSLQQGRQELGHLSLLPEYQFKVHNVYSIYTLPSVWMAGLGTIWKVIPINGRLNAMKREENLMNRMQTFKPNLLIFLLRILPNICLFCFVLFCFH